LRAIKAIIFATNVSKFDPIFQGTMPVDLTTVIILTSLRVTVRPVSRRFNAAVKSNRMFMELVVKKAQFDFENNVLSSFGGAYATLKNVRTR
jgi:hypothetical protein